MKRLALAAVAIGLVGCPLTVQRVTVPTDPSQDAAPIITLTATPLTPAGPGAQPDLEPGKTNVSTTTSVKVSRGGGVMLIGNARNNGGVKSLTMTAARHGMAFLQGTASDTVDAKGTALNTLTIKSPDASPSSSFDLQVSDPIEVTATATNFNGQTTTIVVDYVPADLEIALTAKPGTIGYNTASSSTLTWSVLYGVPPIKIELYPDLGPGPFQATGSTTVSPKANTTYYLNVTDQKTNLISTALVAVLPPPPPPSVQLDAGPNDGYNCLGTTDTLTWKVSSCTTGSSCTVSLTGQGVGYAASYHVALTNLPATGSYPVKPGDEIDFTMTATSKFGSGSMTKKLYVASPQACGTAPQPTVSLFYFAVKASDPLVVQCTWLQIPSDNESDAQKSVEDAYPSGYTVTSISKDEFDHQQGCP